MQLYEGDRGAFDRMLDVMEPMEITTTDRNRPKHSNVTPPPAPKQAAVSKAPPPERPSAATKTLEPKDLGTPSRAKNSPSSAASKGPQLDLAAPAPPSKEAVEKTPLPVPRDESAVPQKKEKASVSPLGAQPAPPKSAKKKKEKPPSLPTPQPKQKVISKQDVASEVAKSPNSAALAAAEGDNRKKPKRQLINRAGSSPEHSTSDTSPWASADGLTEGTGESNSGDDVGLDDLFPPTPRPTGPRDPDGNRALIGKRKGPLSDCYVDERLRDETAAGTIKLLIEVPKTLPNKVSVMRSEFSKGMGACVRRALSDIPFPGDPGGKTYRFAIPFTFRR
ncbi:MAG: hypothetical protein CMH50_13085 [Myxococcales bacterium]|nr:hypothetical protein [Myxococcales bacterium]